MPNPKTTSQAGLTRLRGTEGFRSVPYLDPPGNTSGKKSTGFGHSIRPGEGYLLTKVLTYNDALLIFDSDVLPLETLINNTSKYDMSHELYDSLVSFGYNEGAGALSAILVTWNNTRDLKAVAARMLLYDKVTRNGQLVVDSGLAARRRSETNNFLPAGSSSSAGLATGLFAVVGVFLAAKLFA